MSSFDEESMEDRANDDAVVAEVVVEGVVNDDDASNVAEAVEAVVDKDDDTAGHADVESMAPDDEDTVMTAKSEPAEDEAPATTKKSPKKTKSPPTGKKSRSPAVKGLTIPFRNVKRTMKLDPDIATVQQEAAILTTLAAELFLKSLAKESHQNAKSRGRGTIR